MDEKAIPDKELEDVRYERREDGFIHEIDTFKLNTSVLRSIRKIMSGEDLIKEAEQRGVDNGIRITLDAIKIKIDAKIAEEEKCQSVCGWQVLRGLRELREEIKKL